MIQFKCTHCQKWLSLSDEKAGQNGKCPKCGGMIQVPSATTAAKGPGPMMPPVKATESLDEGEIPLAGESPRARASEPVRQQQPRQVTPGAVTAQAHGAENADDGEIPLAARPDETGKAIPREPETPTTDGGLVITPNGDAMVVSFQSARILDSEVIETIGQELYVLVDQQACRKIVLDFSSVKFLSSQMLGVLINLQKKAAGIKGRVLLCGVHSDLQKLFHMVKLERLLPIVADRHAALGVLSLE